MKLKEIFGADVEEVQLIFEIDRAMARGLPEIVVGKAVVKLPNLHFEKHIPVPGD